MSGEGISKVENDMSSKDDRILIKKKKQSPSVVVSLQVYKDITTLSEEVNMGISELVDMLLKDALSRVEIVEE